MQNNEDLLGIVDMIKVKCDSEVRKVQKLTELQRKLAKMGGKANPVVQLLLEQKPKKDRVMELVQQNAKFNLNGTAIKVTQAKLKQIKRTLEMEKLDEEVKEDIAPQIKPKDQKPVPSKIGPKNDLKSISVERS